MLKCGYAALSTRRMRNTNQDQTCAVTDRFLTQGTQGTVGTIARAHSLVQRQTLPSQLLALGKPLDGAGGGTCVSS